MKAGQANNKKNKNTKIEQIMAKILKKLNIEFFQNVFVLDGINVDFIIDDNIVIECFGDY
jgi:hypothetical protein